MIFKRLTIHNITSIADATIDFCGDMLGDTSIFLITGVTGSGKSTILDCICLALYDKTPRMTSQSREEIAAYSSDEKNKQYSTDCSQFLRRGAGEGFAKLVFEGNDGKSYEAVWAIQRDHKKPHKKLQKPTRSLRCLTDNSFSECNKRPIELKIKEITGLEYDQFCRTVMLPQGEFTKFIKSSRQEKSSILEKLTGTEIYSKIGKRIADIYSEKRQMWERLHDEIRGFRLLTDEEKKTLSDTLNTLDQKVADIRNDEKQTSARLKWLTDRFALTSHRAKTVENIKTLEETVGSEGFRNDENLAADFRTTIEVRLQAGEKKKLVEDINAANLQRVKIEGECGEFAKKVDEKSSAAKEISEKIAGQENVLKGYDISSINSKISEINNRKGLLSDFEKSLADYESKESTLRELTKGLQEKINRREEYSKTISGLAITLAAAKARKETADKNYDQILASTSDAAKSLRALLKEGEECPVCGQKVLSVVRDQYFEDIMLPLKAEKEEADKDYTTVVTKKQTAENLYNNIAKEIQKEEKKIGKATKDLERVSIDLDGHRKLCGLSEGDLNAATIAGWKDCVGREKRGLLESLEDYTRRQNEYTELSGKLADTQKEERKLLKALEKSKELHEAHKREHVSCESRIKELTERKRVVKEFIWKFHAENPAMTEDRIAELSGYSEEYIKGLEEKISAVKDSIKTEKGALRGFDSQIAELEDRKPELGETDSVETLSEMESRLKTALQDIDREIGSIKERIAEDERRKRELESKIAAEEKVREDKEKWEGLYRLLGDQDGARFRGVAQSFILLSLLENANVYMRTFTDRYTLTCNPGSLAILVTDNLRPSEPQPASILSGGESFMASLSLALSLSHLRTSGLGADILFIDEGFGTLSAEYLGHVMETLEKLHQIGGKKVGLISHVTEMKERIPVQIHVYRESPALSKIETIRIES